MTWIAIKERSPREYHVVMTKIDDGRHSRNEQALQRAGNIWYVPDGGSYVYYTPTHWRPLTEEEAIRESTLLLHAANELHQRAQRLRIKAGAIAANRMLED